MATSPALASLSIDASSAKPPYEQLRAYLIEAISRGTLATGERLPPVRQLATDLHVAPGTVARAYKELEAAGIVETRGRNGTVVRAHGDVRTQHLQEAAAAFAEQVRSVQGDPAEALELAKAALRL